MGFNVNPYSNTPIKNLEYIQNKALVIAPFEITKSGLLDTDLMLDTPGTITMYFFRKNFNNIDKEPTAEQFKTVGTVSDINTKLGLDITASNISSSITSSYYLGFTKINVIFKYDKNTGVRTIEKDNSLLVGDYVDIGIDSTCDLTTEDYFVICNVTKNTKATNSSFTESSSMDFLFMIPSSECQEIITDFTLLDANNKTINVKKYGNLGSGFVADNDTTFEPAYQADFFGDGSNVATYLFDGTCRDLNGNYNGTPTGITYGEGKLGQAAVFNGTSSKIANPNLQISNSMSISFWMNKTGFSTTTNYEVYFTLGADFTGNYKYLTIQRNNSNNFRFEYGNGGGAGTWIAPTSSTTTISTDGLWHHYLVVFDKQIDKCIIYKDGVKEVCTTSLVGYNAAGGTGLYIGTGNLSTNMAYSTGKIDQVRIFNRALNSNEVTALYLNNGATRVIKQESVPQLSQKIDIIGDGSNTSTFLFANNPNDSKGLYTGTATSLTYDYGRNKLGYSAKFVAGSRFVIGYTPWTLTDFSMSFWFKPTINGSDQFLYSEDTDNWYMTGYNGSGYLCVRFGTGSNWTVTTTKLTTGVWYNFILVKIGGTGYVYLNGNLVLSMTFNSYSTQRIAFGSSSTFVGNIGEIRLYNKALSGTEINNISRDSWLLDNPLLTKPDFFKDGSNIATYLFNGNCNDETGSYNGTATGITYTKGKFGQAAVFSGAPDASNIALKNWDGVGDFSISLWVSKDRALASETIFGRYSPSYITGGIFLGLITDADGSWGFTNEYNTTLYVGVNAGGDKIPLNTWTHLIVTISGTTVSLYTNGKLSAQLTSANWATGARVRSTSLLYLGQPYLPDTSTAHNMFKGKIDNVRIFNRALNQREVLDLYNEQPSYEEQLTLTEVTGKTLTPSGNPLVVYDFEEGPSIKFVNNRDYLTCPGSNDFAFGTGDFTVETWVKFNNPISTYPTQYICMLNTTGGIGFGIESGNLAFGTRAVSFEINYAWTPTVGVWYHLAATRENGAMKLWINGSNVATKTNAKNLSINTGTFYIGAGTPDLADNLYATVKYLHIIKGVAKYTTNFNRNQILTLKPLQTANTVFLLQVDKPVVNTNNWSKIQLESVETIPTQSIIEQTGKALTNTGVTMVTDTYKNNGGSLYFNGVNYITAPISNEYNFGAGDFTVESWVKFSSLTNYTTIVGTGRGNSTGWWIEFSNSRGITVYCNNILQFQSNTTIPSLNIWYHLAMSRENGVLKVFLNGTIIGSSNTNDEFNCPNTLLVGAGYENGYKLNGYIDDLRIVKGQALYTTNFTPPTTSLVKDANTVFLLQVANPNQPLTIKDPKRKDFFGDKSMIACYMLDSNANDETGMYNGILNGSNFVTSTGKFGQGISVNDTNYVDLPETLGSLFGTNDFSISLWFKPSGTFVTNNNIFSTQSSNSAGFFNINLNNNKISVGLFDGGSRPGLVHQDNINLTDWNHVVVTKKSNVYTIYSNNIISGSTLTNALSIACADIRLGQNPAAPSLEYFNGQIDNVKIFNRALTASEVTSLYDETISPIITLETETETIASEPDFFNDKSNIATYLFEEVKTSFQNVKKIVLSDFVEPMSYKYLQWYFYSGDTYNTKITNYTQTGTTDNTKNYFSSHQDSYQNNRIGNIEIIFNDIIPEIKNAGFRVSPWISNNGTSSFRITAYDINNNIIDTKLLTNLLNGTPYNNMVNYGFIEDYTNGTNPPISFLPNIVKEANGKYNGTATNITYGIGKFGTGVNIPTSNGEFKVDTGITLNTFSISMWFRRVNLTDNIGFVNFPTLTNMLYLYGSNTNSKIAIGRNTISETVSTTAITDLNWHHITMNYDFATSKATVYIDGVVTSINGTVIANMVTTPSPITLFVSPTTGCFDNVRIFNRPLTLSEVQDLYRETKRVKYKTITLDSTNFGPAAKFNIETQKEIKLLNYKTWTGTDATSQGYRIYPVMKIQDHTAEETSFSPKYYLGAKYQRNLSEILSQGVKSKRTIFNLKDMYLVDDLCIQTLKKINILLENNQMIKLTERLYQITSNTNPLRERLNANVILNYISTPVTGTSNSDINSILKESLLIDYHFTQEEIDNLNDNLNTFKSRARISISTPAIQGTNGSLDQIRFSLPKTFVDGNRSKTEKKNLLVFGTDAGFNKFNLGGLVSYPDPICNVTKRDASAALDYYNLITNTPVIASSDDVKALVKDSYTELLIRGSLVDQTGKIVTVGGNTVLSTAQKKFSDKSIYFDGSGDYLQVPSTNFNFGSGDFTIECWVKYTTVLPAGTNQDPGIITHRGTYTSNFCWSLWQPRSGGLYFGCTNNGNFTTGLTSAVGIGALDTNWHHAAVVRNGNFLIMYVDGIQVDKRPINFAIFYTSSIPLSIGILDYGQTYSNFNGYIDDIRISKGIARYTSNFTPEVSDAFKDILSNYKQQIPFTYIPLSTDAANTNNEPVFENLTDITGFNNSDIIIDVPNVL